MLWPLIVALALTAAVTTIHHRLPPVLAARMVTVAVVSVVAAAAPTLWIVTLGYLAHLSRFGGGLEWCAKTFGIHQRIPTWLGLPALAIAVAGAFRIGKLLRAHRHLRLDRPGSVKIVAHADAFAFTLPGRGGRVVLSSGLVELLDDGEQAVVVAHENAHARHRHDRYLLVARCAAATIPILKPLTSRLEFSLERWADEAAVGQCGDRRFVARTLGKVALHSCGPAASLGFTGLGVPARVAALLSPAPPRPPRAAQFGLWLLILPTAVLAAFQIQHLAGVIAALCPD